MFCDFSILKTNNEHVHSDVELFFVVDGEVDFSMEGKTYLLKKDDFLIVNVDTLHGYKARGELLTFCVHVPYSELIQMLKKDMALFWCNTSVENNESCDEVRSIIRKLIWEEYNNNESVRRVLDRLVDGTYGDFRSLFDYLLQNNDEFFILKDFDAYRKAHEEIMRRYRDREKWNRSMLLNIAASGRFSSDRTIEEYANDIWHLKPVTVK